LTIQEPAEQPEPEDKSTKGRIDLIQTSQHTDDEDRPFDKMAVLEKIEAIEKTVGSIKGRISELEAKKKSLDDTSEDMMLLQLESTVGHKKKSHKSKKTHAKKAKK
jgi:hypothetical protein